MNVIKKQFKAFWHYFCLSNKGLNQETFSKRFSQSLPALIVLGVGIVFMTIAQGSGMMVFFGLTIGCSAGVAVATTNKPSALSIAPYSPTQCVVFSLLSALLRTLIALVIFTVVTLILGLIIVGIVFLSTHTGFNEILFDETEASTAAYDGLMVLQLVILFFASYAIFGLEKRRDQIIASVGMIVAWAVLTLTLNNLAYQAFCDVNGLKYEFTMIGMLEISFNYLPHIWAVFLVAGLLTAASAAAAIFVAIKNFKSDKV